MSYERAKSWIANNKQDTILISLSLALLVIYKFFSTYQFYLNGLYNKSSVGMVLLLFPFLYLTFLILFVLSLKNLITVIWKAIKIKVFCWKKLSLAALPILILLLIFPVAAIGKPGAFYQLRGNEKWVAKEVDIPTIRQWLISLPENNSGKRYTRIEDYPQKLPEEIMNLKPQYMYLSDFKDGRYVEFEWGGPFGHWGIRIGMEDMETPKGEEVDKISEGFWEYRRPIQPGVYIFDRG